MNIWNPSIFLLFQNMTYLLCWQMISIIHSEKYQTEKLWERHSVTIRSKVKELFWAIVTLWPWVPSAAFSFTGTCCKRVFDVNISIDILHSIKLRWKFDREKSNLFDVIEMYYWIQWKSSQCDCVIHAINVECIE